MNDTDCTVRCITLHPACSASQEETGNNGNDGESRVGKENERWGNYYLMGRIFGVAKRDRKGRVVRSL